MKINDITGVWVLRFLLCFGLICSVFVPNANEGLILLFMIGLGTSPLFEIK